MQHDIRLEGFAFRLRPVTMDDAALIVDLRTRDSERCRFVHPIPPLVEKQQAWLATYYKRDHDYYWVIERSSSGVPEGLIGIYDIDVVNKAAEWGRWVLRSGSLAAIESAWLVYQAAFNHLGLEMLYCHTIADNQPVVCFHDSCGIPRISILSGYFNLNGEKYDAVRHECRLADWVKIQPMLAIQARAVAARMAKKNES